MPVAGQRLLRSQWGSEGRHLITTVPRYGGPSTFGGGRGGQIKFHVGVRPLAKGSGATAGEIDATIPAPAVAC